MDKDIEIVRAKLSDAKEMGVLHSTVWRGAYKGFVPEEAFLRITPEKRAAFYEKAVFDEVYLCYTVKIDGKIAGILEFGPARENFRKGFGEIGGIYFLKEYRGSKVAAQSFNFAIERLKESGFNKFVLWVIKENIRARKFYEKQGFTPSEREKVVNLGKDIITVEYVNE